MEDNRHSIAAEEVVNEVSDKVSYFKSLSNQRRNKNLLSLNEIL